MILKMIKKKLLMRKTEKIYELLFKNYDFLRVGILGTRFSISRKNLFKENDAFLENHLKMNINEIISNSNDCITYLILNNIYSKIFPVFLPELNKENTEQFTKEMLNVFKASLSIFLNNFYNGNEFMSKFKIHYKYGISVSKFKKTENYDVKGVVLDTSADSMKRLACLKIIGIFSRPSLNNTDEYIDYIHTNLKLLSKYKNIKVLIPSIDLESNYLSLLKDNEITYECLQYFMTMNNKENLTWMFKDEKVKFNIKEKDDEIIYTILD